MASYHGRYSGAFCLFEKISVMKKISLLVVLVFCTVHLFAASPYVSQVFEFVPAPGQFVNVLPTYLAEEDAAAVLAKVNAGLVGKENGTVVSLGAWGGYLVVGFDHTIANVADAYDFKISGNAFSGNSEPGVVLVSVDENSNGLPDDTWYELAGSEFGKDSTCTNYEVTYYRPSAEKELLTGAVADYIRWKDNRDSTGFVVKNSFHTQSYFPQWLAVDSLVFRGTRLPNNGVLSATGSYTQLTPFAFGYADNLPNTSDGAKFKIDWAVDSFGNSVHLSGIDFVKIHTGVLQDNGWIGECSTEVSGVMDLHTPTALPDYHTSSALMYSSGQQLIVENSLDEPIQIFTVSGVCVAQSPAVKQAVFQLATPGVYLVKIGNAVQKVIVRY